MATPAPDLTRTMSPAVRWTELARRTFKRRHGPFAEHAACWKLIGIVPKRGTVVANKLGVADNKTAVLRQCERSDLKKLQVLLPRALYLDFRFAEQDWRLQRPRLARWHDWFAGRPSVQATFPIDDS